MTDIVSIDGERMSPPEDESRAELRRRQKAERQHGGKLVDRQFVAMVLEKYHGENISPILMSLVERLTYLEMWPWQKAWYHALRLWGWWLERWKRIERWFYVKRWNKMNTEVTDRMAAGETEEED